MINKSIKIKESLREVDSKVIHVIDSDSGGGAEKLVTILEKNFQNTHKILTLKKLSKKNKYNPNYFSLNIESKNLFFFIFQAIFKLFFFLVKIRNKRSVIIISHLSKSLYSTFIPSIILGMKHIHTEHNINNRRRSRLYLIPFEYLIYCSLKHIICVSKPVKFSLINYLSKINFDKISILENGIKLIKFKKRNYKKKKFNLLILGSITYKKGIDLFIEAVPQLTNKISQVKIVGSGPEKQNLINLTKKLSLETIIKFENFTPNIKRCIYEGDIGIIPSRWEGFGFAALEMRSSGMPILISDTPALKSIFSGYNAVYTFKNGSIKSLKKKLAYLLDDLTQQRLDVQDLSVDLDIYSEKSFIKRYKKFFSNFIKN
jgi:glycosyltransferase involved in cell wall biosynthesis